ncbi:exodeoxyribonuclease-3 [Austwickia chelonae]|uniref:Putative exodeoxyribonuclease n=1 Tax=Austwickia chelonae NBRC 105200 TaxID=1184607 RepID=K6UNN9_9MICO|nr:exodeoxyribonuclease III [Austwickia chelonae]GAB79131.1 putative exodeoxyribonuclease [Austwickia chelonae NBRC 105200]SEW42523.1 exodeoxyribonuclease-3 [Austwickia chelonae]
MLRIATFNINGIRATQRRGFENWLATRGCDVVALQEVRCPVASLPEGVFGDYHLTYDSGQLAGRNGVALLTRTKPEAIRSWGAGVLVRAPGDGHLEMSEHEERGKLARELHAFADEGRYLEADLADVPLTIACLYLPKGGLPAHLQDPKRMREAPDGGAKYERKMSFLAGFARHLTAARKTAAATGREFLLVGDLNIAHTPQDINNWKRQQKSEGFLPEERAWLDEITGPRTLVDVIRRLHPDAQGPYSWWSWMGKAFANDTGWRIDYQLATAALAAAAVEGGTDRDPSREERMSDHAPVVVDYDFPTQQERPTTAP